MTIGLTFENLQKPRNVNIYYMYTFYVKLQPIAFGVHTIKDSFCSILNGL